MKTSKTISFIALVLAIHAANAQPRVFIPGALSGIGPTVGGTNGVGIFTSSPLNGFFEVNGDVRLNGVPGGNDGVWISSPNAEKGLSIVRPGSSNRADVRFDGISLRLLAGNGGGPPAATSGITITKDGNVGVGVSAPGTDRLNVNGVVRLQGLNVAAANNRILTLNSLDEVQSGTTGSLGIVTGTGITNYLPKWTGVNTLSSASNIYDDGITVGIGTNTPTNAFLLHVWGGPGKGYTVGASSEMLNIDPSAAVKGFSANVQGNDENTGFEAYTAGGSVTYGGHFTGENATNNNTGVQGVANNGTTTYGGNFSGKGASGNNHGVKGASNGGSNTYGGYFTGIGGTNTNHGAYGLAEGGTASYGGRFSGQNASGTNYGVYGISQGGNTSYGGYLEPTVH